MKKSKAAETLKKNKVNIIHEWERRSRENIPAAKKLKKLSLIDSIPNFIDSLVENLQGLGNLKLIPCSEEHGEDRAKVPEFTLDQVIEEYSQLREVIFNVIKSDITPDERELVWDSLFDAIKNAVTVFYALRTIGKDVEHKRLEISNKNLENDQVVRDQFVSTLTHDLKNPLNSAKMAVQMIARNPHQFEKNVSLANKIDETINRIDKMIGDLLDANLIKAGEKLPLNRTECDLVEITRKVCEELCAYHEGRVQFIAPAPIIGYFDCANLRRVIENLASNAIKYGFSNSPVTFRVHESPDEVVASVHNLGNPISVEEQKTVFDPFRRTLSQAHEG